MSDIRLQMISRVSAAITLEKCYRFICLASQSSTEDGIMAAVTIRNLSKEAHRALKVRAARHNRSAEAEMRAILEAAARPEGRLRLGTALSEMSRKIGLSNADVEALQMILIEITRRNLSLISGCAALPV
jgi:plasmid stability protein